MNPLDLSIIIAAVDKFTAPVKKINGVSEKMTKSMIAGQKSISSLSKQKVTIANFKRLGKTLSKTASDIQKAALKTAAIGREIAATEKPTKAMVRDFERAKIKSQHLKDAHRKQKNELNTLRKELRDAGVDTRKLSDEETRLSKKMTEATHKMQVMCAAQAKMSHAQARYDKSIQKAANVSLIAGGISNVGRKLTSALTAPIASAVSFESTMADVKKVINFESPKQFKQMRKDILAMSSVIPLSAQGIGDIVAAAGQANIPREQLLGFAEAAAKMGVAFDLSGAQAGSIMAGWRSSMNLTQQQTNDLADAVNYLSNNMNAQAGDLADVISRQGAVAKAAGLTKEETASLGAVLLSSGAPSEIAATGMKNLMLTLAAGTSATKAQSDALGSLGLDAVDMAQRMQVDAKGAIMEVFTAMSQLDKAEQPAILKKLFGLETVGAIAPILSNLKAVQRAFDLTSDKANFAGSAQQEFEVRSKTTENAIILFNNRLEKMRINFGDKLLPVLNRLLDVFAPILDSIAALADRFPKITTAILIAVGVIGGIALVVAPVITAFAALSVALAWSAKMAQKNALAQTLSGTSGGGFFGGKGIGNKLKGAGRFLKGKGGLIGAGLGVLSIGSTLMSDSKNKGTEITKDVGGIAGALAGGAMGAALGSVVPVIGTGIGGILGSIIGGLGGDMAGGALAGLFSSDAAVVDNPLAATLAGTQAVASNHINKTEVRNHYQITIHAQPGQDGAKNAEDMMREIERIEASKSRSAMHDRSSDL